MLSRYLIPILCGLLGTVSLAASINVPATLPSAVDGTRSPLKNPANPDSPTPGECVAGCAAVPESDDHLSEADIRALLEQYQRELRTESPQEALETLLFYGSDVRRYLSTRESLGFLSESARTALSTELAKTHVRFTLRVVDESLEEPRFVLDEYVPIGKKQHLHPEAAVGIRPPEAGFTVQRVGVHHLWTRL